jgi:hypothetical protein
VEADRLPAPAEARRADVPAAGAAARASGGSQRSIPAGIRRLQASAGNAAVVKALQRQPGSATTVPAPAVTPKGLIDQYTTLFVLDEAALGKDLAARVVAGRDVMLAHGVLDQLRTTDRDDVAEELARAAGSRLGGVEEGLRIRLIREMLDTVVDEDAERQVDLVWKSFVDAGRLGVVIPNQRALWAKSMDECKPLRDRYAAELAASRVDVLRAAGVYLNENRRITREEARNIGLDLGGTSKAPTQQQADAKLDEVRKAAKVVAKLSVIEEDVRKVPVGYRKSPDLMRRLSQSARTDAEAYKLINEPDPEVLRKFGEPALFDPAARPGYPPTGKDTPQMATWDEAAVHHGKIQGFIGSYAREYPVLHASLTQGGIGELANAADAGKARAQLEKTLGKTLESIATAEGRLGRGITHYDLIPIQQQLFTNTLAPPAKASLDWHLPLHTALGRYDLDQKQATDFWTQLGLSMVGAFALMAAPFTGGLTAAVLIGSGLMVGGAQAAASWDRYLNLRPLETAAIKDELSFVQKGAVDAAVMEAVVATVSLFLDALDVRGAMQVAGGRKQASAELHAAVEAQQNATQAARELMQLGVSGEQAGVPAPEPDMLVSAGGMQVDAPADPAPVQQIVQRTPGPVPVQRAPNKQLAAAEAAMAAIDTGDLPLHWGDRFELSVLASVLRGEVAGMEGVTYAFRAQHRSGQGIDIIAVGRDAKGRLKFWHIECKYIAAGSRFGAELGGSAAGIQTSTGWTKDNFIKWWERSTPGDRADLLKAVRVANGGKAVSLERLTKLITDAEVIIAAPLGAGIVGAMRRVWGMMGFLKRAGPPGRATSYREFPLKKK